MTNDIRLKTLNQLKSVVDGDPLHQDKIHALEKHVRLMAELNDVENEFYTSFGQFYKYIQMFDESQGDSNKVYTLI